MNATCDAAESTNPNGSTGPITPEGKAKSCLNAVKHGLTAKTEAGLAKAAEGDARVKERIAKFRNELRPLGPFQDQLVAIIAFESVRRERLQSEYFVRVERYGNRARALWNEDRKAEAGELLGKIDKNPPKYAEQLAATVQGATKLAETWRALLGSLERNKTWNDEQRGLALDLLGTPHAARDEATAFEPTQGDILAARIEVVTREIKRLEALIADGLKSSDEFDRAAAEQTTGAEHTSSFALFNRYLRTSDKRAAWAFETLKSVQEGKDVEEAFGFRLEREDQDEEFQRRRATRLAQASKGEVFPKFATDPSALFADMKASASAFDRAKQLIAAIPTPSEPNKAEIPAVQPEKALGHPKRAEAGHGLNRQERRKLARDGQLA